MDESLFLGCDVGGTTTCAIHLNKKAETITVRTGEAGNPHIWGFEQSLKVVSELMRVVLGSRTHELRAFPFVFRVVNA